jgi:hypothetical protein
MDEEMLKDREDDGRIVFETSKQTTIMIFSHSVINPSIHKFHIITA